MEGSIDFVQFLDGDLSSKILSNLDDPADVVRVASVSRTWRQFVIASGFSKSLFLRLFPEISNVVKAIVENNIIDPFEVETTGKFYAFLARGLAPSLTAGCIFEAISASSTDHYREENIHNTLEPRERVKGRLSYWSSMGEFNPEVHETLTYKLVSKLCCITEINIRPFQDHFDHDFPIYSGRAVRFRMGHAREPQQGRNLLGDYKAGRRSIEDHVVWTYTSEKFPMVQENCLQKFKSPEPVLAIGGLLQIELLGRVQLASDYLYYLCVSHVQVVGRLLTNDFDAEIIDNSGKCVLKYLFVTTLIPVRVFTPGLSSYKSRFEPVARKQV
ncbi:hypothetical protein MKX03_017310 [Papaver bracteatum]|nr:hypothetical protein MKX03_017310 [Papaver bracteatum]